MKKPLYITEPSVVVRKQNTFFIVKKNLKKQLPIEYISEVYCMAPVTLTSGASNYLMKKGVPVHFFGIYGNYLGSLYPREGNLSGHVIIKQVEHYLDINKRMYIAQEIVSATVHNIRRVLKTYVSKEVFPKEEEIKNSIRVWKLRELEAKAWKCFYEVVSKLCGRKVVRIKRPPKGKINCLISYLNSLLYATIITEIFHTPLNPTVSYLHEPLERRFSLALDFADIFKPVFMMRIVIKMIQNRQIKEKYFKEVEGASFLSKLGRKKIAEEFDKKLYTKIFYKPLKRRVNYRELIRFEAYKLLKHIIGDKKYKAFRTWW